MLQTVTTSAGSELRTTRCPIRIDSSVLKSPLAAPRAGEHTAQIDEEFRLAKLDGKQVGIAGLGTMGAPMARVLLSAGVRVAVWNRTASKAHSFAQLGATIASSPAELADTCDFILLMLSDDDSVRAIVSAPDGIVAGRKRTNIVINSSTVSPKTNVELAKLLNGVGKTFVDAPVLGSLPQAEIGKLFFLVGGDDHSVDECVPIFETLGRGYLHLGPVGTGACAKLANNFIGLANLTTLVEALALVEGYGLSAEAFLKVVASGGGRSAVSDAKGAKMLREDWRPDFSLGLAAKDLRLVQELARDVAVGSAMLPEVASVFGAAAQEFGDSDVCALREWYSSETRPTSFRTNEH
jgi:3-hydroxyisobutyrate dehydrogenase